MARLGYATVGSNCLEDALAFYDALMELAGLEKMFDHPSGGRIYGRDGAFEFGVLGPFNGAPATPGNGTMISLQCESCAEVDAIHARALVLGGGDEGAPGYRGGSRFYMSYFRDLDGNKLCAYFVRP